MVRMDEPGAAWGSWVCGRRGSVYAKNCRSSVNTTDSFSGPSVQIFLRTNVVCIVKSFAGLTIDFF